MSPVDDVGALSPAGTAVFASRAGNAEDVVLWRALKQVEHGRGIALLPPVVPSTAAEDGSHRDAASSSLAALAAQGWEVLSVPDSSALAAELSSGSGTGAAMAGQDVHVLAGGDETATTAALAVLGDAGVTPWVVVSASGERAGPGEHDPHHPIVAAGYRHCLFDGVNNFFVHESHAELADQLSYPACAKDDYTTPQVRSLAAERDALAADLAAATRSVVRWRNAALNRWESAVAGAVTVDALGEIAAMKNTVSWRVTRPLRAVRGRMSPGSRG